MAYNNVISRTDAAALIPEDVANEVLTHLPAQSAALSLFMRRTMARGQQRLPVLSALPVAYFVNGDTGQKQTTEANWANKYLNAEEIACICPIPEAVLDDVDYDVWAEIRPLMEEAIGRAFDAAVFFGTNKPASWPTDIVTAAVAAGNTVTRGTNNAAAGGVIGDLSDAYGTVEVDGYDVNGIAANRSLKAALRNTRATTGEGLDDDFAKEVKDLIKYPMRGLWPTGSGAAQAIVGDFGTQGIVGIRQDITYKILTEAVIQDNVGNIVYNLAQQDMVAMRVVFRGAFQVANIINYDQPTEANRYPFGVVRAA